MKKQPLLAVAIIALLALCFTCCSMSPQKETRSSVSPTDASNDTIAEYMAAIGPRKYEQKYDPFYIAGDTTYVYDDITTNSDKMPLYSLDATLPNHDLLQHLTDLYNCARICMSVLEDVQIYERFGEYITDVAVCIDKLDCTIIHDAATRAQAEKCKAVTMQLVSAAHDNIGDDYYTIADEATSTFSNYVLEKFTLSDVSEEEIAKVLNPNNYLADWDELSEKIDEEYLDMPARVQLRRELAERYDKAENFHQKCLLARNITRLDYKYGTFAWYKQTGLAILDELLVAKVYSPFLADVFRDWRCLQLHISGFSNDSAIPNYYYNVWRRETFDTMIRYIAAHPHDCVAINMTKLFSCIPDIYRYLPLGEGNSLSIGNYGIKECMERGL